MKKIEILKFNYTQNNVAEELLAEEIKFTVNIKNIKILKLISSPEAIEELIIGNLLSQGIINNYIDISLFSIDLQ